MSDSHVPNVKASEFAYHGLFPPLSERGLGDLDRARVLEWFATRIWILQEEASCEREYYGKSYDPLKLDLQSDGSGTAHSYALSLGNGRHHDFASLDELEERLTQCMVDVGTWLRDRHKSDDEASPPPTFKPADPDELWARTS